MYNQDQENSSLEYLPQITEGFRVIYHDNSMGKAKRAILTEVNEGTFPIFHPDTNLYGIFGENEQTMLEDELRLYYVALTRAKHSIYILYSKNTSSCFIQSPVNSFSLFQ